MSDALFSDTLGVVMTAFGRKGINGYRPMKTVPNQTAIADPARMAVSPLRVIFSEGAARVDMANNGLGRAGISVQSSFASRYVLATIEASALPYAPEKGDVLDRDDGKVFKVAEVQPDGLGGYVLRMNEA